MSATPVAAAAVAKAAADTIAIKKEGLLQRLVVQPLQKVVCGTYTYAGRKVSQLPEELRERIAQDEARGEDTASLATRRFWKEQRQLFPYRVKRVVEESCHVFSGAYFKDYGIAKAVQDLRFLTQAFFIFLVMVLVGRRTIYPPIKPDSPFVEGLKQKVNPNY